jgi:O-antigen ligase
MCIRDRPFSLYYVGQLYVFRVIQPEELNHPLYPDGRSIYFKFTPLLIMEVAMLFSWLVRMLTEKIKGDGLINILLLGVFCREISAINGGIIPWWAQIGKIVSSLSTVVWLWWCVDYLKKSRRSERIYFWTFFMKLLKVMMIIGSLLVVLQGLKGSGLGLVVEQSGVLPYSGAGSDSGGWLVRPIGFWSHANEASFMILCQLLTWYLIRLCKFGVSRITNQKWLLLPIVALIWLQSRSVFLALFLVLGWSGYFYGKEAVKVVKKIKLGIIGRLVLIGIMLLGSVVMVDRFWNSVTNFGTGSGWNTRGKLISVALRVSSHHLWWGVGDGNFIPVAFREDLTKTMKVFPESVHNGWILVLVEQGLIGMIIWVSFLMFLIIKWWKFAGKRNDLRWFLPVVLFSQFIVMLFQPFPNILTLGVMISMILLASENNER